MSTTTQAPQASGTGRENRNSPARAWAGEPDAREQQRSYAVWAAAAKKVGRVAQPLPYEEVRK